MRAQPLIFSAGIPLYGEEHPEQPQIVNSTESHRRAELIKNRAADLQSETPSLSLATAFTLAQQQIDAPPAISDEHQKATVITNRAREILDKNPHMQLHTAYRQAMEEESFK